VMAPHMPVPFSPPLEDAYVPSPEQVAAAVRRARAGAVAVSAEANGLTV